MVAGTKTAAESPTHNVFLEGRTATEHQSPAERSEWAAPGTGPEKYSGSLISEIGRKALTAKDMSDEKLSHAHFLRHDLISPNVAILTKTIKTLIKEKSTPPSDFKLTMAEISSLAKAVKLSPKHVAQSALVNYESLNAIEMTTQIKLTREAIGHVLKHEENSVPERLRSRAGRYLAERGIPINETDLSFILDTYLSSRTKLERLTERVDMAEIERSYLLVRQKTEEKIFEMAVEAHKYAGEICSSTNFNPKQRIVIEKWIFRKLEERDKNGEAQPPDDFVASTRSYFIKQFVPAQKMQVEHKAHALPTPIKLGTHEKRLESYTPLERSPAERTRDIKDREEVSKETGKPFDTIQYCLSEIERESPPTALVLRGMLEKGTITRPALASLFTKGSLTTKIFMRASQNPDFFRIFGEGQLDALARGLANIGPQGKQLALAKLGFGPRGEEMFRFLERKDLIAPWHVGRSVVYLRRSGNGH